LKLEQITCEMSGSLSGEVIDLSRGGMCVRGEGLELHERHECVLSGFGSSAGPVAARVVWSRAVDHRTRDIGLEFVGLTPQQASDITALAMLGRQRRCFVSQ
jgi:hypothetical protein